MKNRLIIPTHERPEMLWCCVERLALCDLIETVDVVIHEDVHVDKPKSPQLQEEVAQTISYARKILSSSNTRVDHVRTEHSHRGSSFNVLNSFQQACKSDSELILFVEDDIWVTPDWIRWCYEVHKTFHPFATNGNAPPHIPCQSLESVYITDRWFQTFGLSFERTALQAALKPHYEDYGISDAPDPNRNFEWDTWMAGHIRDSRLFVAVPHVPRVYHYGYYSYHMGGSQPNVSLSERVEIVKKGAKDPSTFPIRWEYKTFPTKFPSWSRLMKGGESRLPSKPSQVFQRPAKRER